MLNHNLEIIIEEEKWRQHNELMALITPLFQATLDQVRLLPACEVNILLTSNEKVRSLNHQFRGIDKPTNVLSFPGLDKEELEFLTSQPSPILLGDIALGLETIAREAQEQSKLFAHHAAHLIVHGTLHLLGYDHEEEQEAEEMEALEIQILSKFNIINPYE